MAETCKTCKWWDDELDDPKNSCDLQLRMCRHIAVTDEIKNHHVARHDLIYNGRIQTTGPDFGCIHHEQQETPHD